MKVHLDISWQVSQLYNSGRSNKHKGSAMGLVDANRVPKQSIYIEKSEAKKIINYFISGGLTKKQAFLRLHCYMVYFCLDPLLSEVSSISLCKDFLPTILRKELCLLFPILEKYSIKWTGGRGNKSLADKYANKVRKNPEIADNILTLKKIKSMETPHKE